MVEHQGPRRHAVCQILVHGQDISTRLHPYLISVQVIDNLEGGMDECHIELDDRNAELQIPPDGAELQVCLGWAGEGPRLIDTGRGTLGVKSTPGNIIEMSEEEKRQERKFGGPGLVIVFDGWVTKVESGFGRRGGGRRLWIDGEGMNSKGLGKEVQNDTFGEGKEDDADEGIDAANKSGTGSGMGKVPLKDVMTKVFGFAGMQVKMSPEMEKLSRDFWSVNDSAMNFGKRIANETGGYFKISKRTAVLIGKTEGVNVDGEPMPTIEAIWGINLIGWRIKPYVGRPQYGGAQSKFFDTHKGLWTPVKNAISGGTPFGGTEAIAHAVQLGGRQDNRRPDQPRRERRRQGLARPRLGATQWRAERQGQRLHLDRWRAARHRRHLHHDRDRAQLHARRRLHHARQCEKSEGHGRGHGLGAGRRHERRKAKAR